MPRTKTPSISSRRYSDKFDLKEFYECKYPGCKSFLQDPITLPCKHWICEKHFLHLVESKIVCPECNKKFSTDKVIFFKSERLKECVTSVITHREMVHQNLLNKIYSVQSKLETELKKPIFVDPVGCIEHYYLYLETKLENHYDYLIEKLKKSTIIASDIELKTKSAKDRANVLLDKLISIKKSTIHNIDIIKEPMDINNFIKWKWIELLNDINLNEYVFKEIRNRVDMVMDKFCHEAIIYEFKLNLKVEFQPSDDYDIFGDFVGRSQETEHSFNGYYEGGILNGQKTGYGVFHYKDGSVFEGFWDRNMKHGKGCYHSNNSFGYEAVWNDDIPDRNTVYFLKDLNQKK